MNISINAQCPSVFVHNKFEGTHCKHFFQNIFSVSKYKIIKEFYDMPGNTGVIKLSII